MSTTLESPPDIHLARQLALAPYVERVRTWCDEHAREGNSDSFELRGGGRVLSFEPPEFALIHHSALVAVENGQAGDLLLVEAVGLSLKSLEDLARLPLSPDPSSKEFHTVQAELVLDAALGSALLAEIQSRTRELESRGLVDQARLLGQFNRRVWNAVAEVEKRIAGAELDEFLAEPIETTNIATRNLPQEAPSLTTVLAAALLVATLIWFVLFGPLRSGGAGNPELLPVDFDGQLTRVEAHSPSLFGWVDRARWDGLDTDARLDLVDQVAEVLAESGYSGALLRTEDGVPVAQWMASRGSTLLENREQP